MNNIVDIIFDYYYKYGNRDYIGENITQVEHMTQCAMLAEKNNDKVEVILAAFLHDIGHLIEYDSNNKMGEYGIQNHENIGYNFLKKNNIPYPIPELAKNHVISKRYLVSTNEEYYNNLSNASKKTLEFQGGKMTDLEIKILKMIYYLMIVLS